MHTISSFGSLKWNLLLYYGWGKMSFFVFISAVEFHLKSLKQLGLCDKSVCGICGIIIGTVCMMFQWIAFASLENSSPGVRKLIPQNKFDLVNFLFERAKSLFEHFPLTHFSVKNEIIIPLTIIESHDCLLRFTFTSCHFTSNVNNNKHYARGAHTQRTSTRNGKLILRSPLTEHFWIFSIFSVVCFDIVEGKLCLH